MNSLRSISIAIALLLGPAGLTGARAETVAPHFSDVRVGLAGAFKVGHWTPVRVTVDGGTEGFEGNIEFIAADDHDLTARFSTLDEPLNIAPGKQWTGWRYVKVGRVRATIRAVLRDQNGRVIAHRRVRDLSSHPSTRQWVVTVGADVGVEDAGVFLARIRDERVISSLLTDPADFPDQWFGYEGVNILVVPTGKGSLLETLSDRQFDALLQWLRMGGRIVVSAGRRAGDLFAPEHRFHLLRPGTFVELDAYWKASGLENFTGAAEHVVPDEESPLAVFTDLRGRALCLEGAGGTDDRALVTRYPIGFGEVTYVALDLDLPPLANWPARPRLLARLLQTLSDEEDSAIGAGGSGQVTHVGFTDLSGQFRSALDQFPGVTLVQFSWVAVLLVAYIVLMGPIDFLGLRRLGRLQWTWITFPLAVILFCGVAVWLSKHWKGSQPQVNQVDIIDIDLSDQLVRGTTWANIYSPDAVSLDVSFIPEATWSLPTTKSTRSPAVLVSWYGLPGTGMGGMNTPASVDVLRGDYHAQEYRVYYPLSSPTADLVPVMGLPIQTASTKGLVARWSTTGSFGDENQLKVDQLDLLEGVVTNPLDVELSQCSVYYQNWAYPLDQPLAPGESVKLGSTRPLDLRWRLMGRSVEGTKEVRSPWRRDDLSDFDRILKMLMFYGAASGRAYTGLSHNYQSFIDLSRHLRDGRAILIGRSNQPASRLEIRRDAKVGDRKAVEDDALQRWTYYRIMIPVHVADQSGAD